MQLPLVFVIVASLFYKDVQCLLDKSKVETKFLVLQNEDMQPTVLDCDFDLKDDDSAFTLKWYRNNKTIYQWIHGFPPAPIPEFKNDVDISYVGSTDSNKMYSSLALINPSISSSGDYKCVVQSQAETITVRKIVQVIDFRNYTLNLHRYQIQNETQLECTISNVFPKPTVTILSEDSEIVKVVSQGPYKNEDGYYNATSIAAVHDIDDDPDSHFCIVSFEGYAQNLTTSITSGSSGNCIHYTNVLLSVFMYLMLVNLNIIF